MTGRLPDGILDHLVGAESQRVSLITGAPRGPRPTWDQTWMDVALAIGRRAECTRSQVGCAIVVENKGVWVGYNGAPAGDRHCTDGGCPRGLKDSKDRDPGKRDCVALHAEANALARAGDRAAGGTCYVTKAPCLWCLKTMRATGVEEVVWLDASGQMLSLPVTVALAAAIVQ